MVTTIQHVAVVDFAFDEEALTPEEAAQEVAQAYSVTATLTGRDTGNPWPELRISGPRAYVKACLIKSWGYSPREADDEIHEESWELLVCGQCGRGSYHGEPPVYACTNIECDHEVTEDDIELEEGERLELVEGLLCVAREDR